MHNHLKKLTTLYSVRRKKLIESLATHFGNKVEVTGAASTGVFLSAIFESDLSSDEILSRAKAKGVGLTSSSHFYQSKTNPTSFVLGFGNLNEEEIEEGVRRLKQSMS